MLCMCVGPSTSVLDEEMHARYTGVPRHLPRMQEVGERVDYQLYALATLDGAADMCRPGAPKYLVSHEFSPPQEGSQVRCGKVHNRSKGVRRHLPRMQEVGERVEYQLYALATLGGAADMCRPGTPKYLVSHECCAPRRKLSGAAKCTIVLRVCGATYPACKRLESGWDTNSTRLQHLVRRRTRVGQGYTPRNILCHMSAAHKKEVK